MLEFKDFRFLVENRGPVVVNGQVPANRIFCLLGESGIGKSTFLRAIAGFHPLVGGECYLNGRSLVESSPELRRTGFLFQSQQLFPGMNVLENLLFPLRIRHPEWSVDLRQQKAREILKRARLDHLALQDVQSLSGGESQRIAFCRALLSEPEYFLLDEPFSALDPVNRQDFRSWLKEELSLHQRPTIVVSHDSGDILDLGGHSYTWPLGVTGIETRLEWKID